MATYVSIDDSIARAVLQGVEHLVGIVKESQNCPEATLIVSGSVKEPDGIAWTLAAVVHRRPPGNTATSHHSDYSYWIWGTVYIIEG